jgi:predicted transposase/invertase (TIGR01784 family)
VSLQSPHDALFRTAFESPQHAAELLGALLPDDLSGLIALTSLELQSGGGRGKDLEEFRSDLLFRARILGDPGFVCFLFEHQSSSDGRMPLRVLGYQVRIWERHCRARPDEPLPPIVPVVVSHDPRGWNAPCEFSDLLSPVVRQHDLLRAVTPHFRCIVDDLSRLSDQDLMARALSAFPTLVLWALRDARTPGQIQLTVDQLADALTDLANAEGGRDALEQLFVYISNVAENLDFDQFRARVAQLAPAAEEAIMTIAEQLKAQGLKQGLVQGREEGREEGRRQTLETLMTLKFGPLSDIVSARIQAADVEVLDRWLERILTADSPDAVVEL